MVCDPAINRHLVAHWWGRRHRCRRQKAVRWKVIPTTDILRQGLHSPRLGLQPTSAQPIPSVAQDGCLGAGLVVSYMKKRDHGPAVADDMCQCGWGNLNRVNLTRSDLRCEMGGGAGNVTLSRHGCSSDAVRL